MLALRALVVGAALVAAAAAAFAQSACADIADRAARLDCYAARLDCYDRGGAVQAPRPAFAPGPGGPPDLSGVCTRASPCVGPRGGVHCVTPSGHRRALPRG